MSKNRLHDFLSELGLEKQVIFRPKDSNTYAPSLRNDINKKLSLISPDAVYVFNSEPLILFFDFVNKSKEDLEDLYKKVWSFDNSHIIFLIKNQDIEVFNALNYSKQTKSLEKIDIDNDKILSKFTLFELESGGVWKWFQEEIVKRYTNRKSGNRKKRVNDLLFSNIKSVRKALICNEAEKMTEDNANSLILRLIFVRYLIDRKIKIDDELIEGSVHDVNARRESFIRLIRNPKKLSILFEKLNHRFNGVLFKEDEQRRELTEKQAQYLSGVFAGEMPSENTLFDEFFFDIFDFSIIPVEVISGIYESLISDETRKEDSAIYTPSFLVDYILKDTVDEYLKDNQPESCTVFEVAVGSGIFLVQALRRIIEKEIEINGNEDKLLFSEKIKNFAQNNLYGVDINPEALKVACFSIYIALLDYLEPADINIYQFPQLIGSNLFRANFFGKIDNNGKLQKGDFETVINQVKPKFILGNPPWKKDRSKEHLEWVNSAGCYSEKISSAVEIAQSFLLRTKDFMREDTKCALITTSTVFYNVSKTSREFRRNFLTCFNIDKFLDLSPVRKFIFEGKISPATVVYFHLSDNCNFKTHIIKHQSIKFNLFLKQFKMLVVEKFDQKVIPQRYFIDNDWMFKVALYGNTLDFYFLKRIRSLRFDPISNLVDNNLLYGSCGVVKGKRKNKYPFLKGLPLLENESVSKYFTPTPPLNANLTEETVEFDEGRIIENFDRSKILFKEQAKMQSDIIISYYQGPSVYQKGVFALSSKNESALKDIYAFLISKLYEYYIFMTSGSWGTSTRPQIRWEEEFLSFPIKKIDNKTKFRLFELVDDIINKHKELNAELLKYSISYSVNESLSEINSIIFNQYSVNSYETDIIDYALNVSRYQFQEDKAHLFTKKIDDNFQLLRDYAQVYLDEFSKIYPDEYIQVNIYTLRYFIAMHFIMQDEIPVEPIIYSNDKNTQSVLDVLASNLSISELISTSNVEKNLFIQKDIKGFEKNSFYIIKPNEYKCWHRAMAWYDVSEFKNAIQEAELNTESEISQ